MSKPLYTNIDRGENQNNLKGDILEETQKTGIFEINIRRNYSMCQYEQGLDQNKLNNRFEKPYCRH